MTYKHFLNIYSAKEVADQKKKQAKAAGKKRTREEIDDDKNKDEDKNEDKNEEVDKNKDDKDKGSDSGDESKSEPEVIAGGSKANEAEQKEELEDKERESEQEASDGSSKAPNGNKQKEALKDNADVSHMNPSSEKAQDAISSKTLNEELVGNGDQIINTSRTHSDGIIMASSSEWVAQQFAKYVIIMNFVNSMLTMPQITAEADFMAGANPSEKLTLTPEAKHVIIAVDIEEECNFGLRSWLPNFHHPSSCTYLTHFYKLSTTEKFTTICDETLEQYYTMSVQGDVKHFMEQVKSHPLSVVDVSNAEMAEMAMTAHMLTNLNSFGSSCFIN